MTTNLLRCRQLIGDGLLDVRVIGAKGNRYRSKQTLSEYSVVLEESDILSIWQNVNDSNLRNKRYLVKELHEKEYYYLVVVGEKRLAQEKVRYGEQVKRIEDRRERYFNARKKESEPDEGEENA